MSWATVAGTNPANAEIKRELVKAVFKGAK
jgi:hypothetical protein